MCTMMATFLSLATSCATAVSITNRETLEQIRLCDAEYYGAESLEAEECAPFQPTSTDDKYLSPTEDETDLSRSVRRMSVNMPTGSGSAGSSAQSHGDDETTKVSHEFEKGCGCHEHCYA